MPEKFKRSPTFKASAKGQAGAGAEISTCAPLNHEQERLQKWLKEVRFKPQAFGGVSEADVWKKIAELNTLYEAALSAERARYDALLAEQARVLRAESLAACERAGDEGDK